MNDRSEYVYEQLLVLRCQTGSEPAFAELVGRYGPRLRVYLERLLGRSREAEDVLQDVWADVFRGLRRLENAGAFAAWLYRIARDRAYRELRRRRVRWVPLDEVEAPTELTEPPLEVEDIETLHSAMETLSIEHREVLLLRFLEGMSPDQIAQVTGLPAGTVRSRVYYAKQGLRRELERRKSHE